VPPTFPSATRSTSGPAPSATATTPSAIAGLTAWLGYHADAARTGAVPAGASLASARVAWTANLTSAVFGQPVVADGLVIAATESDRVFALNARTGQLAWSASLGAPLTNVASVAGCGNIDPLGITSTPVIDPATGTVYVVGEIADANGNVHHQLEGLNVTNGAVLLSENVDPPLPAGESPANLLQRAALALANRRIYIAYGGNYGDCGQYHGWLVGVETVGPPRLVSFEVASDGEGGAIWQSGGAPAIDANGDLYVSTGNANPDPPEGGPDPKAYTESVVKLSPTLAPLAAFKDTVAGGDEDLSTGNPVLLPGGAVFAVGKTDVGYVLNGQSLARTASIPDVCGSDPDGGPAYDAVTNRVFVPCRDGGIQVVNLSTDTLGPRLLGANSAPILIGSQLWAAQYPDGTVTEFDTATGARVQSVSAGSSIPNFASPSRALGLLLIGTDSGVTAFAG